MKVLSAQDNVEDAFPGEPRLLPVDPHERAHERIWGDFRGKNITPSFYRLPIKQSKEEQEEITTQLTTQLPEFTKAIHPDGPFLQGDKVGFVDIMVAPHAAWSFILKRYRD